MSVKNEFLRSLTNSEQSQVEALIKGEIPEWLNGTLFRNGPGRYKYGDKTYDHLFDGQACVHKFKIDKGKVFYSNKFLSTNSYTKNLNEQRLYPVFGTVDVCSTIFERFKTIFTWPETLDNVNVNLVPYGKDKLYALTEINVMYEIDPTTLNTLNRVDINEYIKTATTTFAHPHYLEDGSWITMGMNTKSIPPHYEFLRYKSGSKNICDQAEVIASVPSSHLFALSYFHSFGLTKSFIVFLEQSIKFDIKSFLSCLVLNKPYSDAIVTNENCLTKIHLIDRTTGKIYEQKYHTVPMVVFHHINSYEVYDSLKNIAEIIVDVSSYDPKYFDLKSFTVENMYSEKLNGSETVRSIARRIRVPMSSVCTDKNIFCEIQDLNAKVPFELPVINYTRFNGLPYKYVYGVHYYKRPFSIVKVNTQNPSETHEIVYDRDENNCLPSEPIFVESANPVSEDDGVLLIMVLSSKNDFLSVLDAKNLKEIARAEIPENVKGAFTFHGFFANKDKFEKLNY